MQTCWRPTAYKYVSRCKAITVLSAINIWCPANVGERNVSDDLYPVKRNWTSPQRVLPI